MGVIGAIVSVSWSKFSSGSSIAMASFLVSWSKSFGSMIVGMRRLSVWFFWLKKSRLESSSFSNLSHDILKLRDVDP